MTRRSGTVRMAHGRQRVRIATLAQAVALALAFAFAGSSAAQTNPQPPPAKSNRPYAYIGVSMGMVPGSLADRYELKGDRRAGVLVNQVMPDTPAQKAGLRTGDIIHSVNGKPVTRPDELLEAVAYSPIGSEVELDITRPRSGFKGSDTQQVRMTVAERTDKVNVDEAIDRMRNPEAYDSRAGKAETVIADPLSIAGLTLGPASKEGVQKGLRVFSVVPNSEAAMAGFFQGDCVLAINGAEVNSRADVLKILQDAPVGQPVRVTFERDGKTRQVNWSVPLPIPTPTPEPTSAPTDPRASVYDPTNGTTSTGPGGVWRVKQ